ncbi:MAG: hypothetical protein HY864_04015 [Chloroflexi bacterium]|nr:hypothetical protein [Chloroflexota bacterium]
MKSFSRSNLRASENLKAWSPPDFETEISEYEVDIQKEQLLTLFGADMKKARKGNRSALYAAGADQNFSSWLPESIDARPAVRKAEWAFIEMTEAADDESDEAQMPDPIASIPPIHAQQPDLNGEAPMILERARIQAEEIILAAQSEADNVLLQAQSEIEDQKKEGYQQGQNAARLEMEDALKTVRSMIDEVDGWKAALMAQGEQILVEMLKEISRKMFGDGVELDKNALQANLNRIMESAHGLGSLNIFLNPKDARMLDSAWVDQQMLITGGQAKIIPSGNITRGGCYVKGNMGTVDGRVETQLDAFLKTFDEASKLAE